VAFSLVTAFSIPAIGLGSAVSVLVGCGVGSGDQEYVRKAVDRAWLLALGYTAAVGLLFLAWPGKLIALVAGERLWDPAAFNLTCRLVFLAAILFFFDAWSMLYGGIIRGAGDSGYSMRITLLTALGLIICCLIVSTRGGGVTALWTTAALMSASRALAFRRRYLCGGWRGRRLVEAHEKFHVEPHEESLTAGANLIRQKETYILVRQPQTLRTLGPDLAGKGEEIAA
jgi:MATE family multidrug resistance protein